VEANRAKIVLTMEAARTSETLVNFYQTTWHYNPEYSHLRTHRRENLKTYYRAKIVYSQHNVEAFKHLCCANHAHLL
jgi:hypothetical protein